MPLAHPSTAQPPSPPHETPVLLLSLALSLGAAISLGITRFSYGLLLPPMRNDLGWSYTLAGAMNTANAVGYLIGALAMAWLVRRSAPTRVLLWGSVFATLFMAASGFFTASAPLLAQRLLAVMASSRIWAGLLDRHKSGHALALLNALLGVATLLPAVTAAWPLVIASGLLFGGVFLSVVASTTALVRHNLPPSQWVAGIAAFTVAFAAGQIVGPTVVGFIADGPGGLARGLVFSAVALWVGAGLAWRQRAL